MKTINSLLNYKDLKIVQNTEWFSFSLDSVLLANFVTLNKKIGNILDIGTGNAPIPLILSQKTNAKIYAVEIQEKVYELAKESIEINHLNEKITLINEDINVLYTNFESDFFDVITCNPPYFKLEKESILNKNDYKTIARHEMFLNLDSLFKIAKKLLKNNGVIAVVHRPERLIEIIELMKKHNIEPKRLQFIYPKRDSDSNTILIEGVKNGASGLKILKPLYIHDENGNYLDDIRKLFE